MNRTVELQTEAVQLRIQLEFGVIQPPGIHLTD